MNKGIFFGVIVINDIENFFFFYCNRNIFDGFYGFFIYVKWFWNLM